jgi:hypothetical protein
MAGFVSGAGIGPVTVVTRSTDKLDAFAVGLDGHVYTAAWQPGDTAWRGWWQVGDLEVAPCAPIGAVCRAADKLDIFAVGLDGHVYTAAWQPGDTAWRGWWQVGGLATTLHATVAGVSRSIDKLDVVAAGLDGRIYTAAWQPGDTAWRGWWQIGSIVAPPGAPVSIVSRSADKLDAFVVGADGHAYTAAWQPGDTKWRGWWPIGTFQTIPRTPIAAVSRSKDKLDITAVGNDGRIYTAAWQPGDTAWRGWWQIGALQTATRTPTALASRSADKLDVFAVGPDGRVQTAAWQPGDTAWRGWWPVRDLVTAPGAATGVACRSADKLDVVATGLNGRVYTAAWQQGDNAWRGWWFIATFVTGMTDPRVGEWKKVGVALKSENTNWSEEAQGVTTDGAAWFLASNGSKSVRKYASGFVGQAYLPASAAGAHVGSPGCHEGWLYIPIQHPYGVWKTTTDFSKAVVISAEKGTDRFPWCDVNPLNGRLYTSEFDHWNNANGVLFAYDRETGVRRPEDDLALGPTPIHFDRIQGGAFTRRGRLLLSRSGPNGVFCFSAVTGACFGARHLGDFGSTGSEVEGVTVRSWKFGSTMAYVHVLELDNDWSSKDDCYLHSYSVPEPGRM